MLSDKVIDYIHPELNETVKAIGGEYVFIKEAVLSFQNQQVLYLIGCALFDTTCCGTGGCCYARVPGFLREAKYATSEEGRPISRVTPIVDPLVQKEIRKAINGRETVQQIEF